MKYPKFIKENSIIGIPSPSGGAYNDIKIRRYLNAKENLEKRGYKLILSKYLYQNNYGRSSSAINRAKEINEMFKNKDIELILSATGGEFLVEILPYIDFSLLKQNIKYVCGFSDPTGLIYPITTKYDIATIYGQNFSSFGSNKLHKSQEDFLKIINGNIIKQNSYKKYEDKKTEKSTGLEGYNLTNKVKWKILNGKKVSVTGRIIGGCIDIINTLSGTIYDGINEFNKKYSSDGIIWYFDNCELSMEEIIRVLFKFHELNYFKYAKAIIFGRFGIEKTNLSYTIEKCLEDSIISKLNIPIIYNADISHKPPCLTIINGAIANIEVKNGEGTINFNLK